MANITVTFQNLTSSPALLWASTVPPAGAGWYEWGYPISGWQQGTNPSGAVSMPVSGAAIYSGVVFPSGYVYVGQFTTDVTITLATFTAES